MIISTVVRAVMPAGLHARLTLSYVALLATALATFGIPVVGLPLHGPAAAGSWFFAVLAAAAWAGSFVTRRALASIAAAGEPRPTSTGGAGGPKPAVALATDATPPAQVDLGALVDDCCTSLRAIAAPKQMRVVLEADCGVIVSARAADLRRAVLKLGENAIRYSPEGSTVAIAVTRLDEDAVIAVEDEGVGIAHSDVARIFDDSLRPAGAGGPGGLALARDIVREHRGRIQVTGAPGRGSTFLVFLPAAPTPAAEAETRRDYAVPR